MNACRWHPLIDSVSEMEKAGDKPNQISTAIWASRFYHALQDFLDFIDHNQLASYVHSFTLISDKMFNDKLGRFPHKSGSVDWRYPAAAAFWQHLLSKIRPSRITIIAPPIEIACLTNATIDTFGDW